MSEEKVLPVDDVVEMDERRIRMLNESGINEMDVLGDAMQNLNIWENYFNENVTRGKDDLNFVLRDQWTAIERSEFSRLFKPAMTYNKLYDVTKKIAGEQRSNKPDLIVRSLTGKATQEQINLRADLVRTISYQSQNDLVYQTAFKSALMLGYGAFQIDLDYESPRSFNQIIKFCMIPDPTKTTFDPSAVKPHKGDGNFCARRYVFSKEEFTATYPYITNPVSYTDPRMLLDFQWETRDTIIVCDYFVKEWYPEIIYKLSNGVSVTEDEWDKMQLLFKKKREIGKDSEVKSIIEKEIPHIVAERQTQDYKIMHYRLIKDRIIDFSEWPSKQLPIIFVDGDSYFIEGRQYTKSFIHEARDAQKLLNYSRSELAAELKNRRREQWVGTPDNIIGYEQQWRNPELQMGILMAKPDPKTGSMPQKMPAWEVSQGIFAASQAATQDIKEILGVSESDPLMGKDVSGKARREKKTEGSMSSMVYFDNLNQAIEQAGRVVLDLLPSVYGQEDRYVIVSKPGGKTQPFILNQRMPDGSIKNELDRGDYDIEIDTGPSFAVQKEISLEFLQQTLQANPQCFPLIADLWAKNLDVQFMPQIAERFKTMVPPDILAKEEGTPPPPKPDPQQMMMQMEMQAKQADMKNKMADIQIKAEKLKLEQEQAQLDHAKLMLEAQKLQTDAQLNIYDHQLNLEKARATHGLDHHKSELDFNHKISAILADIYKHENPK